MIHVVPVGGLCNRLRVVASARLLAQKANSALNVHWLRTPDFNAAFDRLFEVRSLDFEVSEHGGPRLLQKLVLQGAETLLRISGSTVLGEVDTAPGRFDLQRALSAAGRGRLWLRSNSRLAMANDMYAPFVPVEALRERIAAHAGTPAQTVGVHIRRTDNARAADRSPLHAFELSMQRQLDQAPDTRFFVATDDPQTLQALCSRFGDRVLSYPKRSLARNDPRALEDAVVDLFCLAQSRHVLGSYWSSFSETAWELNDLPHEVVGAVAH